MYFHSLPQQAWLIALIGACGFALWKGGTPERIAAIAFLAASFVQPFVLNNRDWLDPQWGVFIVDSLLFSVLVGLVLRTDRIWLLWAAAFQLLSMVIHFAMLIDRSVAPLPYRRGLVIWSYLTLAALSVGVWQVWKGRQAQTQS